MRFDSFAAFLAVSTAFRGVDAGLVVARQGSSSVASAGTGSSAIPTSSAPTTQISGSFWSTEAQISQGLIPTTLSDGTVTTTAIRDPQATDATPISASTGTATFSRASDVPVSTDFPVCHDTDARPFCLPSNMAPVYVGKTYYTTWNADFFPIDSTVQIKVQWANDSSVEIWSSDDIPNQLGYAAINMQKEWLQGYFMYNLSLRALNYLPSDPKKKAEVYDGPTITLSEAPLEHLPPSAPTKFNKEGLMIGLPVTFGFVVVVVIGLWVGMRKNRTIGIGNIMGRRKGYSTGKSRRQRLGMSKNGAIRLKERETGPRYSDVPREGHNRGYSLGSPVSDDDEIRPAPGTNHFRDEISRQHNGR